MHFDAIHAASGEEVHEPARLIPTLIGAVIGAIIAVAVHVVIETGVAGTPPYEATWFALVIGLATGLGVRMANRGHMGRNYARGAASGLVALAAIVLSTFVISQVMARRDAITRAPPAAAAAQPADGAGAAAAADDAAAAPPPQIAEAPIVPRGVANIIGRPTDKLNPWQFVFMALGGLIAYELGRGVNHGRFAREADGGPAPATASSD